MRLPNNNSGRSQSNGQGQGVIMDSNEADFSEFMWMAEEDLEEFDNKVISEIAQVTIEQSRVSSNRYLRDEEEEFWRNMLEEEEQRDTVYFTDYMNEKRNAELTNELTNGMQKMGVAEEKATESTLNPNAAEFTLNPNAAEFVPQSPSGSSSTSSRQSEENTTGSS